MAIRTVVIAAATVVVVIVGIWLSRSSSTPTVAEQHVPLIVLERKVGFFNDVVAVVRANKRGHTMKALVYGKSILGGIWEVADRPSVFTVFDLMDLTVYSSSTKQHALIIGLGIGNSVKTFNRHGIVSDVVEIDPVVVEFARKHFGFTTQGGVHTEDALVYLAGDLSSKQEYYGIFTTAYVHDVFSGSVEARLYTVELLKKINSLLTGNGILVLNYLGKQDSPATLAVLRTLRALWKHVRCFADVLKEDEDYPVGNLVFFASHNELSFDVPEPDPSSPKYSRMWMLSHHSELEVHFDNALVESDTTIVTDQDHSAVTLDGEFKEYFWKGMLDLFTEKEWEDILRRK